MSVEEITWEGSEALRPFLIAVDELQPFAGNPRRGDVEAVRASLRRFGQTRPILIEAEGRIVAGHHVRLAAQEEGWTHVAAIPHEFKSEDEARAYLLTDNRSHDLGIGYDTQLLVDQLRVLADADALDGTGYGLDDLDRYVAELNREARAPTPPAEPPPPTELQELVLMYSAADVAQLKTWLAIVEKELGSNGPSESVYAAVEHAARDLNS